MMVTWNRELIVKWWSDCVYILKVELTLVVGVKMIKMTKMLGLTTWLKHSCCLLTWQRLWKEQVWW